jgi:hypothetical protein
MLNLDVISNNCKDHKEKDYYKYRKVLHGIYDLDVYYGDLVGDILAYREKNRLVESISIDMKDYKIYTELSNKAKDKDTDKVVNSMNDIIANFIDSVTDQLNNEEKKELIDKYNHTTWPIFDFYVNGSSIEFNL